MTHRIGRRTFDFSRQVAVMAVVNRTPDSFFDQGATFALDRAVDAALAAAEQGADWVDIGGVPFGRGPEVTTAEEIDRVAPVVEAIAARSDVVISVDTNKAEVARAAIAAGSALLPFAVDRLALIVAVLVVWGAAYGGIGVATQAWIRVANPGLVEASSAMWSGVFNAAIAAGSFAGGLVFDAWGGTAIMLLGAAVVAVGWFVVAALRTAR